MPINFDEYLAALNDVKEAAKPVVVKPEEFLALLDAALKAKPGYTRLTNPTMLVLGDVPTYIVTAEIGDELHDISVPFAAFVNPEEGWLDKYLP